MEDPMICIITDNPCWKKELERALGGSFTLFFVKDFQEAISLIKEQFIGCIVVAGSIKEIEDVVPIKTLKNYFPHIPLLIYGRVADGELGVQLGKLGIHAFIYTGNLDKLVEEVQSIVEQRRFHIDFKKFGIEIENLPFPLKKVLRFMGDHYLEIRSVKEIAYRFKISLGYLVDLFRSVGLITPKQFLLALKLYHAAYLMTATGMSLKKIAERCGFTNAYQFYRLFHRKLDLSATEFRNRYNGEDVQEMFFRIYNKQKSNPDQIYLRK